MTADYALPPPDKWAGREITPDNYVHDWEAGHLIWLKQRMPIIPPNLQLPGTVHII